MSFVINTKRFLFLLPVIIIFIIVFQLFSEEKKVGQKLSSSGVNRQTASTNFANNLAFSFRRINNLQKSEKNGKESGDYVSEAEKKAMMDLNYLSNSYFFANKNIDQASFQQQSKDIQIRISQNQKLYNEMLNYKLEDTLLANDNKSSTQLFAMAASLPLGPSNIQNTSEKILIDLTSMDREWDEELFKNALQFYYVQNLIKNEKNATLIEGFIDKCPNETLKKRILQIDKEINIYSKNEEAEQ